MIDDSRADVGKSKITSASLPVKFARNANQIGIIPLYTDQSPANHKPLIYVLDGHALAMGRILLLSYIRNALW